MKPRVLVLTTYYHPVIGGVETHARQLVAHLHRTGFGVEVVTKRVRPADPDRSIVDDVPVHRVGPAGERSASGKWIASPAFAIKMLALSSRFDVILCVDYRGIGVAAVAIGALLGRPVIVQGETAAVLTGAVDGSRSGLSPESATTRLLKWPARAVYRRADHIMCIGRDLEREALRAGVPRDRVHYQPPGVDLTRFHPPEAGEVARIRRQLGWPADRLIALFVGRLSTEKGAMDLVEAWEFARRPEALLVLVGPDMPGHPWDVGAAARAWVAIEGLDNRVRFEGPASDTSIFYRAADLFVQPSHFEAFGSSAVEAMASGLPIVSSGVGGLGDFLVDGQNALLHEPRSPASLAAALRRMLDDAGLRERLAKGAYLTAQGFEQNALLDQYARLIESTVASR